MSLDPFAHFAPTPDDPLSDALEVPSFHAFDLPVVSRAILINSWSDHPQPIRVTMAGGAVATLMLTPGILHKLRITRIHDFPGPQNNPVVFESVPTTDPTRQSPGVVIFW